jgi:DNA-binding beta-propeller fold protein YncE
MKLGLDRLSLRNTAAIIPVAVVLLLSLTTAAWGLELTVSEPPPTLVGASTTFAADVADAVGTAEIRWSFGDGEETEFTAGALTAQHSYAAPGHYSVLVVARDESGFQSRSFVHTVHTQPTSLPPQSASSLLFEPSRGYIIAANTDNDTVTIVDAQRLEKVAEIAVFDGPVSVALSPRGELWVVHQEDYAVALIDLDELKVTEVFRLPYASQPMGVVFTSEGDGIVPLMALGEVIRIDGETHQIKARKRVAPFLRGISLSGDGHDLWVTRFISPTTRGEVFHLDADTLDLVHRYDLLEDTTTEDTSVQGRGLPNYLFSVSLSPDGKEAWIPGKKDNMARGLQRDGLALTHDNTVRPVIAILDIEGQAELFDERIDMDDRNLPRHVTFSPLGDYAFVTIFGSNMVEVRDTYTRSLVTGMRGGKGVVATVLTPEQRLFVLGDLSRSLVVYDVSGVLAGRDNTTQLVTEIGLVETEELPANVLLGKQLFANADDSRMASEGYLSCASCHLDGFEDGRVWEFLDRGEGLRNTTSLLGRRGTGHGPVHWSGNFDEIEDFEGAIRAGQGGLGFMTDDDFLSGTRSDPLGDSKSGFSTDLDALAAYVTFLSWIPRSPYRNADGSLTEDAQTGREIFEQLGCDSCHSGPDFTDSAPGVLHDVGTLTPESGNRLGGELTGIDTPTLLGIWQTAPYLHDGSAATLRDVLISRNPEGKHGDTASLSEAQIDQLVAYLEQIDHGLPPTELTLVPPDGQGGAGGAGGAPNEEPNPPLDSGKEGDAGCSCDFARLSGGSQRGRVVWWLCAIVIIAQVRRRRKSAWSAEESSFNRWS